MKPIPTKRHEAQETATEESREHKTGREAHPDSPMARKMRRHRRRNSRGSRK